jgi:hypothetical protein
VECNWTRAVRTYQLFKLAGTDKIRRTRELSALVIGELSTEDYTALLAAVQKEVQAATPLPPPIQTSEEGIEDLWKELLAGNWSALPDPNTLTFEML